MTQSKADATQEQGNAGIPRLLLLSCAHRKLPTPGRIVALQRYDGPAFQVLRRYLRESRDDLLHIWVLSAEYGLISSADRIPDYDRKMNAARAAELQEPSLSTLKKVLGRQTYAEMLVCMSRTYLIALPGVEGLHRKVRFASPGQGKKLASLRRWLRGEPNGR